MFRAYRKSNSKSHLDKFNQFFHLANIAYYQDWRYRYGRDRPPDEKNKNLVWDSCSRYGSSLSEVCISDIPDLKSMFASSETQGTCGVGVGSFHKVMCVGPGNDCECLSIGNLCPYPMTAYFMVDLNRRAFELEAGKTSDKDACSTRSGQRVASSTFRPWAGYPKPGQPKPNE